MDELIRSYVWNEQIKEAMKIRTNICKAGRGGNCSDCLYVKGCLLDTLNTKKEGSYNAE